MADSDTEENSRQNKAVLFLHVHKTAGTTLHRIIEKEYNPFRIYTIEGKGSEWSIDHLKRLPEWRRVALRVVKGHMSFGLHEFLPQPSTYITFLRDPVERCISSYFYSKGNRFNPFYHRINQEQLDLAAFLEIVPWNNNLQCKMIAGIDRREYRPLGLFREMTRSKAAAPDRSVDSWSSRETLQRAQENLRRYFSFVGVTECFTESLVLLKHLFGWKLSSYSSYRKSRNRLKRETFDAKALAIVEERNQFDRELYNYGKTIFDDLVDRLGIDLEREAANFLGSGQKNPLKAAVELSSVALRAAASRCVSLV